MQKDKLKTIVIIALSIIIIGIVGIYTYNQIQEQAYQKGINDASLLIHQQILNSLNQNGYVPFAYTIGNETQQINLVPYQNEN